MLLWRLGVARAARCCLGGVWLVCVRAPLSRSSISKVHSQQESQPSRPTGTLTARVLMDGGSARPRVSSRAPGKVGWGYRRRLRLSLSRLPLSRLSLGTAHLSPLRLDSARPRAPAATRPLGHSPVFSHFRSKTCLYR